MRRAWTVLVVFLVSACGSSSSARSPEPQRAPDRAPDAGRVSISPEVNAQLTDWMGENVTVIADVIEIDATRVPFSSEIATQATRETDSAGRRIVERLESADPATGVSSLTLTNRSGFTTTIETLPRMNLGGGRQFIARDRLVIRYVPIEGVDRPVSLTATATGDARLIAVAPDRRVTGASIVLRAHIAKGAGGYEFRSAEERRP